MHFAEVTHMAFILISSGNRTRDFAVASAGIYSFNAGTLKNTEICFKILIV